MHDIYYIHNLRTLVGQVGRNIDTVGELRVNPRTSRSFFNFKQVNPFATLAVLF